MPSLADCKATRNYRKGRQELLLPSSTVAHEKLEHLQIINAAPYAIDKPIVIDIIKNELRQCDSEEQKRGYLQYLNDSDSAWSRIIEKGGRLRQIALVTNCAIALQLFVLLVVLPVLSMLPIVPIICGLCSLMSFMFQSEKYWEFVLDRGNVNTTGGVVAVAGSEPPRSLCFKPEFPIIGLFGLKYAKVYKILNRSLSMAFLVAGIALAIMLASGGTAAIPFFLLASSKAVSIGTAAIWILYGANGSGVLPAIVKGVKKVTPSKADITAFCACMNRGRIDSGLESSASIPNPELGS